MRFVFKIVVVGYATSEVPTVGSRVVEGLKVVEGSKQKLERFGFPANGAVRLHSEIDLRLFLACLMAGEESSWQKIGGVVGDDRFRGEVSPQTSYRTLHLYPYPPVAHHSLPAN
jgi:hypothetical protein